jgi:hypothetical protein
LEIAQGDTIIVLDCKVTDVTYFRAKEHWLICSSIDSGTDPSSRDEHGDFNLAKCGLGEWFGLSTYSNSKRVGTETKKIVANKELCGPYLLHNGN